ncbi:hypothetical protein AAHH79_38795, partial [Burkholderia pseudomallei]
IIAMGAPRPMHTFAPRRPPCTGARSGTVEPQDRRAPPQPKPDDGASRPRPVTSSAQRARMPVNARPAGFPYNVG